jgi:hypothetical protein
MQHGLPLATRDANSFGTAGPFFLEAGVSSTWQIASFWGLSAAETTMWSTERASQGASSTYLAHANSEAKLARPRPEEASHQTAETHLDPNAVIAAAFQAAGLPSPQRSKGEGTREVDPRGIIDAALKAAGLIRG